MEAAENPNTMFIHVYALTMCHPQHVNRIYKTREDAQRAAFILHNQYLDPIITQSIMIHRKLAVFDTLRKRVFLMYPQSGIPMDNPALDHLRGFKVEEQDYMVEDWNIAADPDQIMQ